MRGGRHFSKQHIQLVESNTQTSVRISHRENTQTFSSSFVSKNSFRGGDRWKATQHFDTNHTSPHTQRRTSYFFFLFTICRQENWNSTSRCSSSKFHHVFPHLEPNVRVPASLNNGNVLLLSSTGWLGSPASPNNPPMIHHPTDLSGLGFGFGLALAHEWAET